MKKTISFFYIAGRRYYDAQSEYPPPLPASYAPHKMAADSPQRGSRDPSPPFGQQDRYYGKPSYPPTLPPGGDVSNYGAYRGTELGSYNYDRREEDRMVSINA
jgi:hypothetical protein